MKLLTPIISIMFLVLAGCSPTTKYVYPANGSDLHRYDISRSCSKTVAVVPFEEMRSDRNQFGAFFLYLIPLSPGGFLEYERPESAYSFNYTKEFEFTPSEDLAKSAAYSLRKSNLFKDAYFTFGGDKNNADYLLEGEILSTRYKGNVLSYGLSAFGPLLWFVGLPSGSAENVLSLALTLTDMKSGNKVWRNQYKLNNKVIQGLYYNADKDVKGYAYLMQDIMNEAVRDMSYSLKK